MTKSKCVIFNFFLLVLMAGCNEFSSLPIGDQDNGGLTLPEGFEAMVVVDSLPGAARHIAVSDNGDIYVKLRFSQKEGNNAALRDIDKDGRIDSIKLFGDYEYKSSYGTEMRIHNGYLYFSTMTKIFRQKMEPGKLVPETPIELILTDTMHREHGAKPIAFDKEGNMYVPFGTSSDCCQVENRTPLSPGIYPCPNLEYGAGIWKFDANKVNQFQWDGELFATGVRSVVGTEWNNESNNLYALMHGRDYLHFSWPMYYTEWEAAILPSEEFLLLEKGDNVGWPYAYYDHIKGKMMQNPEYGGNGKMEAKDSTYKLPVMGFPGHFAPNDLLFYSGNQFPAHYKNGAFIAFHGSTSSMPYSMSGYFVGFVPFKDGKPSGPWEVFANGFAGTDTIYNTSDAKYRPMGLSQGPDGSIYVSDSEKGKIWRIMHKENRSNFGPSSLENMKKLKLEALNIKTPDSIKDNLDRFKPVYSEAGKLYNTYCSKCHQRDGLGNDRFPPLVNSEWLLENKELPISVVLNGMRGAITVKGKTYSGFMPAMHLLSDKEISQILTYVREEFNNLSPISEEEVRKMRAQISASR